MKLPQSHRLPARTFRGSLLAALAALLGSPLTAQEPPGRPEVRSFRDAEPHHIRRELRQARDHFGKLPKAPREALDRARALAALKARVEGAALKALGGSKQAGSARGLEAVAAAALVKGDKAAALAALVLAVERFPDDGAARLNLAGLAAGLGFAAEALGLCEGLDASGLPPTPMGSPAQAQLLHVRGYALLCQGHLEEARRALGEAVRLAPHMVEAERALALAQEATDEAEAQKFWLMGCWRQPVAELVCGGVRESESTGDPVQDALKDGASVRPAIPELFDISAGIPGRLTTVKFPGDLAELKGFLTWGEKEILALSAATQASAQASIQHIAGMAGRPRALSEERSMDIDRLIQTIDQEPAIRRLHQAQDKTRKELVDGTKKVVTPAAKKMLEEISKIEDPKARRAAAIALSNECISSVRPLVLAHDTAVRAYWREKARYMTGLAANLGGRDWHKREMLYIQGLAMAEYGDILGSAVSSLALCRFADPDAPVEHEGAEKPGDEDPGACPESLRRFELELKLGEMLSVSATCEKVGVEVGAEIVPGLGAFVKLEVGRGGAFGVQMGPKAEVGVAGQSVTVKDGMYVEVGADGAVKDVGFMVSAEQGSAVGPVKINRAFDEMRFSFLPTPGP